MPKYYDGGDNVFSLVTRGTRLTHIRQLGRALHNPKGRGLSERVQPLLFYLSTFVG